MNKITISPDVRRGDYERIVDVISSKLNVSPEAFKDLYSVYNKTLILPIILDTATSSYTVGIRKGVNTPIPGEIKVDQNDFFATAGLGLRFGRAFYNTGTGAYSNYGNYPKFTYPDPSYFTGINEADGLQNILNGTLQLNVSGQNMVDGLLCQELCWQGEGRYASSGPVYPQFGGAQLQRVPFALTPSIVLDGNADNNFTITLLDGTKTNINGNLNSSSAATQHRNVLYLVLDGWLIKNLATAPVSLAACKL